MHLQNKPYDGFFVTVEGGDGSGKTTFTDALSRYLEQRSFPFLRTREPGGSPLSEHLRALLLDPHSSLTITPRSELLLFLSARVDHLETVILPALHQGKIVICERFHDSTIAYQGSGRHLGMKYVEELCLLSTQYIQPDCTFFLDIDPEEGLKRVKNKRAKPLDRLEQIEFQFHRDVRQGFLHLADQYPDRIKVLDASLSPDAVFEQACMILNGCLKSVK